MSKMRQVTKAEYGVLTLFHPGEIRYYVDVGTTIARRHAKKAKPVSKAIKGNPQDSAVADISTIARSKNGPHNSFMQLGVKGATGMKQDSKQYAVYVACCLAFRQDPTKVLTRGRLTADVVRKLPELNRISTVIPAISTLIKLGYLRYTGSDNASA